jgi:hypothetical protein
MIGNRSRQIGHQAKIGKQLTQKLSPCDLPAVAIATRTGSGNSTWGFKVRGAPKTTKAATATTGLDRKPDEAVLNVLGMNNTRINPTLHQRFREFM